MDNVSRPKRSLIMASVKAKGNRSTELAIVSLFRGGHIVGWKRHYPLPGNPDFVFLKQRIALFVDGCLWHGCPRHCRIPHTNRKYWLRKIRANSTRDKRIRKHLQSMGWTVLRVWEHDIKTGSIRKRLDHIKRLVQERGGAAR
ncbi:MAG: DNA mismatch endonuclease Vsr [Planctomycetes bacterium]|nr:DNA mismatch endonuclease Vsr [Planctomycetota bacterium]